jgi:hypothetical protein
MNLLSWPVIIGAVVIGSPALWAALVDGTLSTDVALLRVGVCGVGIWIVLSVVVSLGSQALASTRRSQAESDGQQEGRGDQRPVG